MVLGYMERVELNPLASILRPCHYRQGVGVGSEPLGEVGFMVMLMVVVVVVTPKHLPTIKVKYLDQSPMVSKWYLSITCQPAPLKHIR